MKSPHQVERNPNPNWTWRLEDTEDGGWRGLDGWMDGWMNDYPSGCCSFIFFGRWRFLPAKCETNLSA